MAETLLGEAPGQPAPSRIVVELVDGNVRITGPIHDRGLCYLMLELAKDAVREHAYRVMAERQAQELQTRQLLADIRGRRN